MRSSIVTFNGEEAGRLIQHDDGAFSFSYLPTWLSHRDKPAISLTLPKREAPYHAPYLFACFFNMLPEGVNREMYCKYFRIDDNDDFGLLLTVAPYDTIGAINVIPV